MTDSITRGGQTTAHTWRMRVQVFKTALTLGFWISVAYYLYSFTKELTFNQLYWIGEYYRAFLWAIYNSNEILNTWEKGTWIERSAIDIIENPTIIHWKELFYTNAINSLFTSILVWSITAGFILLFFTIRGKSLTKKKHTGGSKIVSKRQLIKDVKSYNKKAIGFLNRINPLYTKNTYKIASIPYPHGAENTHTLIVGSTGTGKTVEIRKLLKQIRANGDRAIVFDRMRTFTETFFEEDRDILLNPLDARCPKWNVFYEARDKTDFENMAHALIPTPSSGTDPFWHTAARNLFEATSSKMWKNQEFDNQKLLYNLLNASQDEIAKIVKETHAQNLVAEDAKKMTQSVQAILSTYVKSLEHLPNEGKEFSIRNWVENDNEKGFLFLTSSGHQHASLRPLISLLLEISINSMLSLNQSRERKLWIILDELASLHNIPSLTSGLTESRQFGGCFVLGLQALSSLRSTYGRDTSNTILTNTRTQLCLAQSSFEEAELIAKNFGVTETETTKESLSFGANTIRDGNNLNIEKREKRLVSATDLQNLKNLEGYLKFPQGFSVAKIKLKFDKLKSTTSKFIPRKNTSPMDERDQMNKDLEQYLPKAELENEVPINHTEPTSTVDINDEEWNFEKHSEHSDSNKNKKPKAPNKAKKGYGKSKKYTMGENNRNAHVIEQSETPPSHITDVPLEGEISMYDTPPVSDTPQEGYVDDNGNHIDTDGVVTEKPNNSKKNTDDKSDENNSFTL